MKHPGDMTQLEMAAHVRFILERHLTNLSNQLYNFF